jgi:hypothetical protein
MAARRRFHRRVGLVASSHPTLRIPVRVADNSVRYSDAMSKMPDALQERDRNLEGAVGEDDATSHHRSAFGAGEEPLALQRADRRPTPQVPPRRAVWRTTGRRRSPPRSPSAGCHWQPVLPRARRLSVATWQPADAAPVRTAVAPSHVGLDVRIERIEPIEAGGRRRRPASACSAGHGAPTTGPPSRAPWSCISATRTASRPNGEIWTSRVLRGLSMPQINHYCASKASLRGDSRQIHAGIAHRIGWCDPRLQRDRASSRSPNHLTSLRDREHLRVEGDAWRLAAAARRALSSN